MKFHKLALASLAIGLTFTACEKSEAVSSISEQDTVSSKNNEVADNLFSDIDNVVNMEVPPLDENETKSMALKSNACATITFELSSDSSYVQTATIDFGTGCTFQGRERTGKIIVTKTGKMRNVGSQTTITTEDYTVDGYAVEGSKTNTTSAIDIQAGTVTYNTTVRNGKITAPDGSSFTWEADRVTTIGILSGEISITGSASGVNQLGISFSVDISSPIILQGGCTYITSGTIDVTPQGLRTRTVDYGDGTCDNIATVTVGNDSVQFEMR